jgi:hypothetical protein
LALLAEPAYEHDEDLAPHAAPLLHGALVSCDARRAPLARRARRLLLHLAYSLLARHSDLVGGGGGEQEGADGDTTTPAAASSSSSQELLRALLAVAQAPPWPRETPTPEKPVPPSAEAVGALARLMSRVLGPAASASAAAAAASAIATAADGSAPLHLPPPSYSLSAAWADVALDWALRSPSRHDSARSHAALRALAPRPTPGVVAALVQSLARCYCCRRSNPAAAAAASADLALTLHTLVDVLPDDALLLQPAAFWAGAALLASSTAGAAEFSAAAALLGRFVRALPLHDATVQNVLLALAPVAPLVVVRGGNGADGDEDGHDHHHREERARGAALAALLLPPQAPPHPAVASSSAGNLRASFAALVLHPEVSVDLGPAMLPPPAREPAPPPRPWALAPHLLPPSSSSSSLSSSSPPHQQQVLAIQQLLWKGLLLSGAARLAALRLATQLAAQLAQLAPAQRRVVATATATTTGLRRSVSSSTGRGHLSSSAAGNLARGRAGVGSSSWARLKPTAAATATATLPPRPPHEDDEEEDDHDDDPDALTRSAPELRHALRARRRRHARTRSSLGGGVVAAAAGAAPPSSSSSSLRLFLLHEGGQQQQQQQAALPPRRSGGRPPGSRHVYQALLGHRHAQVLTTAVGAAPAFGELLVQRRRERAGSSGDDDDAATTLAAARECLTVLAAACDAQGLPSVARALEALAREEGGGGQQHEEQRALAALGAALARTFFPRHAAWFLRACCEMLGLPGTSSALKRSVMVMLAGGLRAERAASSSPASATAALGATAAAMLADAQGPLLGCVARLGRENPECLSGPALSVLDAAMAAVGGGGGSAAAAAEAPVSTPSPSLVLPEGDTALALSRVLEASTRRGALAQLRRREHGLLPFLGER